MARGDKPYMRKSTDRGQLAARRWIRMQRRSAGIACGDVLVHASWRGSTELQLHAKKVFQEVRKCCYINRGFRATPLQLARMKLKLCLPTSAERILSHRSESPLLSSCVVTVRLSTTPKNDGCTRCEKKETMDGEIGGCLHHRRP